MSKVQDIKRAVDELIENEAVAGKDKNRLLTLINNLDDDGCILYPKAIELTQPNSKNPKRGYENFISRLNSSIEDFQESYEDEFDFKISKIGDRVCFFAKVPKRLNNTLTPNLSYEEDKFIDTFGVSNEKIKIFISYATKDLGCKNTFVSYLEKALKNYNIDFEISIWEMKDIPIGVDFDSEIKKRLEECNYGFTLISTNFIKSDYIMEVELPILLDSQKVFPIGLVGSMQDIKEEINNLKKKYKTTAKELLKRNIYMLKDRANGGAFFSDCAEDKDKRLFVVELLKSLSHRKIYDTLPKKKLEKPIILERDDRYKEDDFYSNHKGEEKQIATKTEEFAKEEKEEKVILGVKIQDSLKSWLFDSDKYPQKLYALLGDFGMGKTFNLRLFSKYLWDRYQKDSNSIIPFYIDLRDVDSFIYEKDIKRVPYIQDIIYEALRTSKNRNFSADEIIKLHSKGKLVLIIDGLDEKMVHYNKEQQDKFLKNLMEVISPQQSSGKTILSCRNHFFETDVKQNNFFLGKGRVGTQSSHYIAMNMLPLSIDDMREFLQKRVSKDESERVLSYIISDDYLASIASRPFLLSKIIDIMPRLQRAKAKGEKLNTASFYKALVADTFARDEEKNQIEDMDKIYILKKLAYLMYEESIQTLPIYRLNKWFLALVSSDDNLIEYQDKSKEILKQDLRNSTLLARFKEEDFGFSHTSFQEYFLALYIFDNWSKVAGSKGISSVSRQFLIDIAINATEQDKKRLHQEINTHLKELNEFWLKLSLDLLSVIGLKVDKLEIKNSNLSNYHFKNLSIDEMVINQSELYGSYWSSVNIEHLTLNRCNLSDSYFEDTDIKILTHNDTLFNRVTLLSSNISIPSKHNYNLATQNSLISKVEQGHSSVVTSVAFSPDGNILASASWDNTVKIWSIDGNCLATFEGHSERVSSVTFSPDGNILASASWDNTVKIWSIDGNSLATFEGHSSRVNSVAFSLDGNILASASYDKTVKLWSIDGNCLATFEGHSDVVKSVAFSPDGNILASASDDSTVKIWSIDGNCLATFEGHSTWVNSVAFSPDSNILASASDDSTVKLWSIDGNCLATFEGHSAWVNSVAFSPDGNILASASSDETVKIWSIDGNCLVTFEGHSERVNSIAFSPDGKILASASSDRTVKIWSIDGNCLATFEGHSAWVNYVAFSPDGNILASASGDATVKIWSIDGNCLATFEEHSGVVNSVAFSPDGNILASASCDNTVKIWSIDGNCLATLKGHSERVNSIAFSPDGKILASASWDNTIKLWSFIDGNCLATFEGHSDEVTSVAFSPDGNILASASYDKTVKLWSIDGNCLATLKGHSREVASVAFSPDGKILASASWDNTIKIWSIDGNCLATFEGHSSVVTSVAFSPDGNILASASSDSTIRYWDIDNKSEYKRFASQSGEWYSIDFKDNVAKGTPMAWKMLTIFDENSKPFTLDRFKGFEVYRY